MLMCMPRTSFVPVAPRHGAGYLVLEDFSSAEDVAKVKARAKQIIEDYDASNPSIFSTVNQVRGLWLGLDLP